MNNKNCYPGYMMESSQAYYPDYPMYRNDQNQAYYQNGQQDDRFLFAPFLAPFLVGGVAGTALGYGIANNNQMNNKGCCMQPVYYYPPQPTPYYSNNNYYY